MVNIVDRCDDVVKVQRVLVSVSDKSELDKLVPGLIKINPEVHFYSTGGTFNRISQILGPEASSKHLTQVSDYTGQPETQGGLVKTLDFKIYLGLLTETYNPSHQEDLTRTNAIPLDMVVVNLYPFQATAAALDVTLEKARANIDIGGPCMLRAAAKNFLRVVPVVDPHDYPEILAALEKSGGSLDISTRFKFARKAFEHTAQYDAAISAYFAQQRPEAVPGFYTF